MIYSGKPVNGRDSMNGAEINEWCGNWENLTLIDLF